MVLDIIDYTQQTTKKLNNQLEHIPPFIQRDWPEPVKSAYPILSQYDHPEFFATDSDLAQGMQDWADGMQDWANGIQARADKLRQQAVDDNVRASAEGLATDVRNIVGIKVVYDQNATQDTNPAPDEDPPEWMQRYNYFASDLDLQIDILSLGCPAAVSG